MDGNPHSATAALIVQRVTQDPGWYGDTPMMQVLARAQVEATLGLVWEQRTANLIACSQKVYIRDSPDAIRERLGEAPLVPGVGTPTPEHRPTDAEIVTGVLNRYQVEMPNNIALAVLEALEQEGRLHD